jgi:hypothetical protein
MSSPRARLLAISLFVGAVVGASPGTSRACQPGSAPARLDVLTTGGGSRPVLHLTGQLHARGVVTLHLRQVRACQRAGSVCRCGACIRREAARLAGNS